MKTLDKILLTLPPLSSDQNERHQGRIEGIVAATSYPISFTPVILAIFLTTYMVEESYFISTLSLFGTILSLLKLLFYED